MLRTFDQMDTFEYNSIIKLIWIGLLLFKIYMLCISDKINKLEYNSTIKFVWTGLLFCKVHIYPLCISDIMDKLEYNAVIKFFILDGLLPTEIHPKLVKVYTKSIPLLLTVTQVIGLTCSPRDPRFTGSNPAEVDGFFQDVKVLSTSTLGGTLNWGSRV